jgi:pimeloyl-ACP methyl ester carboxylesterase
VKVQLQSGTLNYIDEGSGPPILLIHAFPLDHTMWEPQIGPLSKGYRVIAPDIRGFGESLPASPWTIEEMAGDLDEFLGKLDVADCVVAGVSMGGYIALPFWTKYPKRVRKLVLANTRARADNEAEKAARNDMIATIQQQGASILPDRMSARLLKPNPPPEIARRVRSMIDKVDAAAAIYAVTAMRDRPDSSSILHRVDCPTMVVSGENDVIIRLEDARATADAISRARFVQIPESGHLSNLENPTEFNRALFDFLAA